MISYVPADDALALEAASYMALGDTSQVHILEKGDSTPDGATFIFTGQNVRGYLEVLKDKGLLKKGAVIPPEAANAASVVSLRHDLPFRGMTAALASGSTREAKYAKRFRSGLDCLRLTLTRQRLHPKVKKPRPPREQPVLCGGGWRD